MATFAYGYNQNIYNWDNVTAFPQHSVVLYNGILYWAVQDNYNVAPVTANGIDNTEVGLGFNNCIWSVNYFYWTPAFNSQIETQDLNRKFTGGDGLTLSRPEKINKNQQAQELLFDVRSDFETSAILEFLRSKNGATSFYFFGPAPYNLLNKYVANEIKHTWIFYNNNTISAKFKLVFT